MLIWFIHVWLFWASARLPGSPPFESREWYFLPTCAGLHLFSLTHFPDAKPPATLITRQARPFSPVLCRYRTRPVFRLRSGDLDGDGREELIAGVIRPDLGNQRRVYIFSLDERLIQPRWFGSRLSFRLDDFETIAIGNRTGLVTREHGRSHRYRMTYQWYHWGFRSIRLQKEDLP